MIVNLTKLGHVQKNMTQRTYHNMDMSRFAFIADFQNLKNVDGPKDEPYITKVLQAKITLHRAHELLG